MTDLNNPYSLTRKEQQDKERKEAAKQGVSALKQTGAQALHAAAVPYGLNEMPEHKQ